MELLIGSLVSLTAELLKFLANKFGREFASYFLILIVFVLSVIGSGVYLILKDNLDMQVLLTIWATAIGFYEVVIKLIVKPALVKLLK